MALLLCSFLAVPIFPEPTKESYGKTLAKSAGSSVASSVGLMVAKELTGAFYDATCAKEITKDVAEQYFCNALAGFSGRSEAEWKAKIESQLTEINGKLDTLQRGQEKIQQDLDRNHREVYRLFKQAAAEAIATKHEVNFETLWKKFRRQFDGVDADVEHDAMIKFANEILNEDLPKQLGNYSTVLTSSFRGNQALLRYPFYDYKDTRQFNAPPEAFNGDKSVDKLYEAAEKAFMDARAQQEKVHTMVLWAIKVLESECQLKPAQCKQPSLASKDFKKDYEAYTKDQLARFNEGLDWLLFAYSSAERHVPWFMPDVVEDYYGRANFLNASITGDGNGAWGRVIGAGNSWNGEINLQCGSKSGVVKPRFSYPVAFESRYKYTAVDWWVSRSANDVYDEVHFAKDWKVYHYFIPDAKEGPCEVSRALPGKGVMPWVQPGTVVMKAKTSDGREVKFGSFIGIQRAGGTYAMASGAQWRRRNEPFNSDDGTTANVKNARYDWDIYTDRLFPHAAVLYSGRGEYKVFSGGRVKKFNQIYLYNDKKIWFPEGGEMKLGIVQGGDCAKTCLGSSSSDTFLIDYNVENGGTDDKEKGKMDAVVAVFLHHAVANIDAGRANRQIRSQAKDRGVYLDRSYGSTSDRKTAKVEGRSEGSLTITDPSVGYHLQYLIEFDMETEGHGAGATQWIYRGKITPAWLFVTK
ncbi:MAG TPA: hypothetical protein VGQ36_04450 [Thermoanaerobaculia bacterium]|nr:hypothetical protein [Thermoanaerobaculia bacterium]